MSEVIPLLTKEIPLNLKVGTLLLYKSRLHKVTQITKEHFVMQDTLSGGNLVIKAYSIERSYLKAGQVNIRTDTFTFYVHFDFEKEKWMQIEGAITEAPNSLKYINEE